VVFADVGRGLAGEVPAAAGGRLVGSGQLLGRLPEIAPQGDLQGALFPALGPLGLGGLPRGPVFSRDCASPPPRALLALAEAVGRLNAGSAGQCGEPGGAHAGSGHAPRGGGGAGAPLLGAAPQPAVVAAPWRAKTSTAPRVLNDIKRDPLF
jgi:hypothetical protein